MHRHLADLVRPLDEAIRRRPALAAQSDAQALLELLRTEYPSGAPASSDLLSLVDGFGLTPADTELLVIAVAPELDVRFGAAYALLLGGDQVRPTLGLALELAGYGSLRAAARARLSPGAPLMRHDLLALEGPGPSLLDVLRVAPRVVVHLLGIPGSEPELATLTVEVPARCDEVAQTLALAIDGGVGLAHVRSRPGTTGLSSARGALALLGSDALIVDLSRRPAATDPAQLARLAGREAALRGAGLVLTGADECLRTDRTVLVVAAAAPGPVIVVDDVGWDSDWMIDPPLTLEATPLSRPERAVLWGAALDAPAAADDVGWQNLLGLRMSPQAIVNAVQTAVGLADAEETPLTVERLHAAALHHGTTRLETAAVRTVPRATLASLVLSDANRLAIEAVVAWARIREPVFAAGQVAGQGSKGHGLTVMFTGSPGTGKSLAAEAVAGELGLELYTVDLSLVVDKYIGETEKRLERVITEAENLNVVLFFDEADALFSARSSVSDSRDRYANQGVSYLLQRIERFEGLAILATNLRGNLDPAFTRRLHHVVSFSDPDAATRRRLWEAHLREVPGLDPDDEIDLGRLAETVELTGGDIRNVVMAASFAAAAEQGTQQPWSVGRRHIVAAVEREFGKLARRSPGVI